MCVCVVCVCVCVCTCVCDPKDYYTHESTAVRLETKKEGGGPIGREGGVRENITTRTTHNAYAEPLDPESNLL